RKILLREVRARSKRRENLPRAGATLHRRPSPTPPLARIGRADLCILRPETPARGLFRRFAAKKFCLGESVTSSALAAAKARICEASCGAREREEQTAAHYKNPQFIGISAMREKQIAFARATENLFDAVFAKYRQAFVWRQRGAALTHKIKRSHCYF